MSTSAAIPTSQPTPAKRRGTRPSFAWWVVVVLASLIVVYALGYVVVGPPMYPENFAASFLARPWGIYPHALFGALAALLLFTTLRAYAAARRRDIATHRQWMVRSYALIFAAVTLRIELPLLAMAFGDFLPGYQVVAWLCWVPNALWAEWYVRRTAHAPLPTFDAVRADEPSYFRRAPTSVDVGHCPLPPTGRRRSAGAVGLGDPRSPTR